MVSDRNQIAGILALHSGLINSEQMAIAIEASGKDGSIAFLDLFHAKGWIDDIGRDHLARLLEKELKALDQGPAATLAESASPIERDQADQEQATLQGPATEAGPPTVADDRETRQDPNATVAGPGHLMTRETAFLRGAATGNYPNLNRVAALGGAAEGPSRYARTHLHAKGGIGQVWLAKDGDLGREVALKELRPEQANNLPAWSRFLEEARITGQLEHPGIVPVYELATSPDDGKPFYTMRFIRGGTLHEAIRVYHQKRAEGKAGPIDLASLLTAFLGVCNAVAYAHSRGVIHRDLKGQNVVLGDFGEVMVLDWGLAKKVDQPAEGGDDGDGEGHQAGQPAGPKAEADDTLREETMDGQVLGTPSYMAPEQAEGRIEALDRRTDIYGLGAILYELLAGRPPYTGAATLELLRMVREDPPEPPTRVVPGTPRALEAISLKAMAKKPEDRYPSAMALADDVRRWIADEPVSVHAEPWTARLGRWGKRHRAAVTSAAASLVALTAIATIAAVAIGLERDEASRQRAQARLAVDEMYTKVADQWLEDRLDPLQREMLEKALRYYEGFTSADAGDPVVRLERGRAFVRLGDVLRKLGRLDDSEAAYRRGIDILGALGGVDASPRVEHAAATAKLASTIALRTGATRLEKSSDLYRQALAVQDLLLAASPTNPSRIAASRTARGLAENLRRQSRLDEAEKLYRRAIARSEQAEAGGSIEAALELAASLDGLGVVLRELDRRDEAEALDRRSIALLEPLMIQAPNLPRVRDLLAKAYNSLGLVVMETQDPKEAEPILRRQVSLNERLAEDFPDRPEYRRTLARGLKNLGLMLRQSGRSRDAEATYRQALVLNDKLALEFPEQRTFLRDQAICLNNLGELVATTSRRAESEPLFARALKIDRQLARDEPNIPAHRLAIAGVLNNQGIWLRGMGRVKDAIATLDQSAGEVEPLVVADPGNATYRREQARALTNLGNAYLADGDHARAEASFRKAVGRYEELVKAAPPSRIDKLDLANCLSGRGANQTAANLPGAEDSLRRSVALFDEISGQPPLTLDLRRKLAASRINLGDFLRADRRLAEAEVAYEHAVGLLDALVAENPSVIDLQADLADGLGGFGKLRLDQERLADARPLFDRAVKAGRVAYNANPRQPAIRKLLGEHLLSLATVLVRLGQYADAARTGDELIRVAAEVPGNRGEFARLMVRCMPLAEGDARLTPTRRAALAGAYADRAIAQLREALENKEPGAEKLVEEEIFHPLRSRDGFKTLPMAALETVNAPTD